MAHEEQNDPVAQSSMYQRRPPNLVASTADLSERDIKENPVVKEEETNDTEVFEEVVVLFLLSRVRYTRLLALSYIFYMGMGHLFPLVHLGPRVGDQKIVAVCFAQRSFHVALSDSTTTRGGWGWSMPRSSTLAVRQSGRRACS